MSMFLIGSIVTALVIVVTMIALSFTIDTQHESIGFVWILRTSQFAVVVLGVGLLSLLIL